MIRCMTDAALTKQIGLNASKFALTEFDLSEIGKRMSRFYETIYDHT